MEESTKEFEQLHAKVDFLRAALTHEASQVDADDKAFVLLALVNQIVTDCQLLAVAAGRVGPWAPIFDRIGSVFACEDPRPHYHSDGLRGPYRICVEPSQGCYQGNGFMVHNSATCQCVRRRSR